MCAQRKLGAASTSDLSTVGNQDSFATQSVHSEYTDLTGLMSRLTVKTQKIRTPIFRNSHLFEIDFGHTAFRKEDLFMTYLISCLKTYLGGHKRNVNQNVCLIGEN